MRAILRGHFPIDARSRTMPDRVYAKRTEAEALILILNCTHTHSVPYRHLNIFITTSISAHDNFEESGWKSGGEIFNLQTIGLSVNLL